jgi:hypothetical protein
MYVVSISFLRNLTTISKKKKTKKNINIVRTQQAQNWGDEHDELASDELLNFYCHPFIFIVTNNR